MVNKLPLLKNADMPLTIETYEGSGQACHPDILKFRDGFKGGLSRPYTHIMAMTPYPEGWDFHENPSVVVSNNPTKEFIKDNIPNPLSPQGTNYHADTDLVYHNGVFHLFYLQNFFKDPHRVKTSRDLVNWSAEKTIRGVSLLSPAIIFDEHENRWKMWGVEHDTWKVKYYESKDDLIWRLTGHANIPELLFCDCWGDWRERNCWHLDIQKTRLSGEYIALITYANGSQGYGPCMLFYGESPDGLSWDVPRKPILIPTEKGWDRDFGIYRSTFIVEENLLKVWYSAANKSNNVWSWGIGYAEAEVGFEPTDTTLNVISS